ncbi:MAG: ABC transporter permease [Prevotella sp.]|nr:ABC transporter permease [Prevotella sp.]
MNFPFYVARRYLFSKKSTNVINIISAISMVGVAIATMAMVVTLSVFNGFSDLVATLFTDFDPQLKVTPVMGKTVAADLPALDSIRRLPEVLVATDCVEDQAMAVYGERQAMVTIKGVTDNFDSLTHIRRILKGDGRFELHATQNMHYGILGIRLADQLGTGYRFTDPLRIYAPRRQGQLDLTDPEDGFVREANGEAPRLYSPGVIFSVQQSRYDKDYILTSIGFARSIFDQQGMLSSLELRLKPGSDFEAVKSRIKSIAGPEFRVQDRYEQQDDTFRIMKIEKLIAYIFLTFILIVACFNIIGSLSMLIIDKKADVQTLRSIGAGESVIKRIFLFEGNLISAVGALSGIIIGLLLCWIQQRFGVITLGNSEGSFIVNAYPVSIHPTDIIVVFLTVMVVSFLASWYPVHSQGLQNRL